MKTKITSLIAIVFLAAACSKKITAPAVTPGTNGAADNKTAAGVVNTKDEKQVLVATVTPATQSIPAQSKEGQKQDIPSESESGKSLYSSKCSRCHALKNVGDYTYGQWEPILKKMIPRANLNEDEKTQLLEFIKGNAK